MIIIFLCDLGLVKVQYKWCVQPIFYKCVQLSPVSIQTQALAFLAVFVYATHATQVIAFEWKPGFTV